MASRIAGSWRWWLPQLVLLAMIIGAVSWFATNMSANIAKRGLFTGFGFLDHAARFPISESILPYSPIDSFFYAFMTGLGNTLFLTLLIILSSTLLGLPVALARRSNHRLASALAGGFVELVRNTPLVVQLLFWYGALTISLPAPHEALQPLPGVFLTDRGLYFTTIGITGAAFPMLFVCTGGLLWSALLAWRGRLRPASLVVLGTVLSGALLWLLLDLGVERDTPRLGRFNFSGGFDLSPEFVAVLIGSVIYASAFAAEIMRGGIDAVAASQWEASKALGMTERDALRFVVMPQALRIMVPPMTSQFINILKNSTLALVVGYPELTFIANTAMNHSGQAIEIIAILILVFLTLAGLISLLMGRLNAHASRPG